MITTVELRMMEQEGHKQSQKWMLDQNLSLFKIKDDLNNRYHGKSNSVIKNRF